MTKVCRINTMNLRGRKIRTVFICFIILVFGSFSNPEGLNGIDFGAYDNGRLILAKHDSLKIVTGIINSMEGDILCRLYIFGKYSTLSKGAIKIYNPVDGETYDGKLTIDKKGLIIQSDNVIFPCQRIMDLSGGESFLLTKRISKDIYLGIVKAPKAFLYDRPDEITIKKPYLVRGDIVSIKQCIGTWMKVAYLDNPSLVKWVKSRDLEFGK